MYLNSASLQGAARWEGVTSARGRPFARSLALLLLLGLAGCEVTLDDEPADVEGDPRFASSRERCVVPTPASVRFSLDYPEGVYLISGDTGAGIALPVGTDPCAELGSAGTAGFPAVSLLDFTEQEREAGLETPDGYRLMLVPLSGFVSAGEGFLFYEKRLQKSVFEVRRVGVGVARLPFGEPAERLLPNRYPSEPTLLWFDSRGGRASSAVLGRDGLAYVYDVLKLSQWDFVTYVSAVKPEQIDEPEAYRYHSDIDWASTPELTEPVLTGAQSLSVVHHEHLDAYVFIFPALLDNTVIGMIADNPWGPFGEMQPLYEGTPPSQFWIRDVAAHAGLQAAEDRRLVTSYYTSPLDEPAGLRLVDVALR